LAEIVWRLTRPEHAPGLDGEGARLFGGRWNSPGIPAVYCASSLALAVLETYVRLPLVLRRVDRLPEMAAIRVELPAGSLPYRLAGPTRPIHRTKRRPGRWATLGYSRGRHWRFASRPS
jgi:RES domain